MERKPRPPSMKGPEQWFTGDVWIDGIAQGQGGSTVSVAAVHFTPGSRTAWHRHAGGQHLYITEGEGLVQTRGEPVETIRPGDVTHTPDGEWHWHGATADHTMTHLSITDGQAEWGDHVTEAEYEGKG
jgi:quercetin dioxygenase-like cupin family protein